MSTSISAGIGNLTCFTTFELFPCFTTFSFFEIPIFSFYLFVCLFVYFFRSMINETTHTTLKETMMPGMS